MEMRENVLDRVKMMEEKNGIQYAKKGGRGYSRLRILYTVAGMYTLGIHLLFVFGLWMLEQVGAFRSELMVMTACTAVIIVGYVMTFFRWNLIPGVVSVLSEIALVVLFSRMMEAEVITNNIFRYKPSFYYRHLAPLAVMVICITIMTVIALREKAIVKKTYKKVLENLYQAYREKQGDGFTEEAWQEFLNSYDPARHHEFFQTKEGGKQKFVSEETGENERKNEETED